MVRIIFNISPTQRMSWWTFRIFFVFSARKRGRGSPRRREGGGLIIENPERSGLPGGWARGRGGEGSGGCLRGIGGGGG